MPPPLALGLQRIALMHAETVLLVDDGEREIGKVDILLEQRVRAEAICVSPLASASSTRWRALPFSRPVSSTWRMPAASQSGAIDVKCCRAKISVGAIIAACPPASTARAMASRPTRVLPLPTSPCSRRSIRRGAAMSSRISRERNLLRAASAERAGRW